MVTHVEVDNAEMQQGNRTKPAAARMIWLDFLKGAYLTGGKVGAFVLQLWARRKSAAAGKQGLMQVATNFGAGRESAALR
jgi:hypothetical protein